MVLQFHTVADYLALYLTIVLGVPNAKPNSCLCTGDKHTALPVYMIIYFHFFIDLLYSLSIMNNCSCFLFM